MKHKLSHIFIATLMAISFVVLVDTHNHNVQAAQKTIQTIRYNNSTIEALAYNKHGKYLTGKNNLIKTDAVLTYYGAPRIIRGQKYACYYIGNGKYIPLNSIGKIDGKNTFRLLNNSYIYNIRGKKIGKLSYKYPVHFTNNLKKTNQDKKYFVIKSNRNSKGIISSTQKYYLPYKKNTE